MTDISNLAPVCKEHHRRIRTLSITEFRTRLEMEEFFKSLEPRKLDDVLEKKVGKGKFGKELVYEISDNLIKLFLDDRLDPIVLPLYTCPSTNYKYFYISLPVKYIQNDTKLQPRPLEMKRLWELYRHLFTHTQLSPAICRLQDNKILLFDGQHKSAAQIWCGRNEIEYKVYIEPDIRVLKVTNLAAHDKLRQMQFFTSVLISKWADLFKEEWGEYLETEGMKSEKDFVEFLVRKGKKKSEALNIIRSNIYNSILDDKNNEIVDYIAERNRTRKNPLTIYSLKNTIFKHFIVDLPLDTEIEKSDELREFERNNVITLLNILAKETLEEKWEPKRNDSVHKVAERIYTAGALKAWSRMLRDVIAGVLRIYDEDERKKIFLRKISDDDWKIIRGRINRLFENKLWTDPSPVIDSDLRVNNEKHVKEFFESKGLKVDWILGVTNHSL